MTDDELDQRLELRDITRMCEQLAPDDADHQPSTIVTPYGNAKVAQNEVELAASMARAALVEWEATRE